MTGSNRNGIWFALLLLAASCGCRQAELQPAPGVASPCRDTHDYGQATLAALPAETAAAEAAWSRPAGPSVQPVRYQAERLPPAEPAAEAESAADAADLPPPLPESAEPPAIVEPAPPAAVPGGESPVLVLNDVLMSVFASFPLLRAELAERQVAGGRSISAWGPFDLNLEMNSTAMPQGFYKNYRSRVILKQAIYRGGYVYGGYRAGRDDIQPWFKERQTNEGGEFKVGAGVPLLQGRPIDKYRTEILTAELALAAVEPGIQAELLQFLLAASDAYWDWVAAGRMYRAQEQLLEVVTTRVQQIEERIRSGDLEQIALIDNQRLIASRETKLIEARRKLEQSAIKLSLFLRDATGQPVLVDDSQVPEGFPPSSPYPDEQLPADIQQAWSVRPELQYLDFQVEQFRIELANAENMLQPRIDARLEASKDIGAQADPKLDDKTPFELEAGIYGEVPLQRREAFGKVQSLKGKLSQVVAKRQYAADKVAVEVQDAVSALQAAEGRIDRARTAVDLAQQSLDLGQLGFESGDLTVFDLNLREQVLLDDTLELIQAQADFWKAWAAYQAALGANSLQPSP